MLLLDFGERRPVAGDAPQQVAGLARPLDEGAERARGDARPEPALGRALAGGRGARGVGERRGEGPVERPRDEGDEVRSPGGARAARTGKQRRDPVAGLLVVAKRLVVVGEPGGGVGGVGREEHQHEGGDVERELRPLALEERVSRVGGQLRGERAKGRGGDERCDAGEHLARGARPGARRRGRRRAPSAGPPSGRGAAWRRRGARCGAGRCARAPGPSRTWGRLGARHSVRCAARGPSRPQRATPPRRSCQRRLLRARGGGG